MRLLLSSAMVLLAFGLSASAQAQSDAGSTSSTRVIPQDQDASVLASVDPETENPLAFTGRVVRNNGEIQLLDPVTKVSYQFDDSLKVKNYLGKRVKVVGTLSLSSNTIHIHSVEPAS